MSASAKSNGFRSVIDRLNARDPERDGLRRAVRAAIVVPVAAALPLVTVAANLGGLELVYPAKPDAALERSAG